MELAEREKHFKEWIESHTGIMIKVTRSFSNESDDFEDLLQEILIQLWKSIPAFKRESSAATWIYRVALNRALVWKRKKTKHRNTIRILNAEKHLLSQNEQIKNDRIDVLYSVIRKLEKTDRVLILLALDELSYREIAQIMDITESNVGVRLSRVKRKLSQLVKGEMQ